jgi:hypothetical protein
VNQPDWEPYGHCLLLQRIICVTGKLLPSTLQTAHKLLLKGHNFWWLFSSVLLEIWGECTVQKIIAYIFTWLKHRVL